MVKCTMDSPLGVLLVCADEQGICSLDFYEGSDVFKESNAHIACLKEELEAYFRGELKTFRVALHLVGTPFQQSVWEVLRHIPYGQSLSYTQEAAQLNHPKAIRAVANANGKNPVPIVVPCHRVIAKDGGIGGYSGGLWRKEFMLELERKNR